MRRIVLSGPSKNALGTGMMEGLLRQLREAGGEPVLLTGEGDAFSAGLDLAEVHALDGEGMTRFLTLLGDLTAALYHYPGPTAVAVNGHAIAGGAVLMLMCDHRVATTNPRARIGLNEVALGLAFPPRLLACVQDCVPRQHQIEVLLGAGLHEPQRALALGMVDAVAEDPVEVAAAWLERVSAHPAGAYAKAKVALRPAPAVDDKDWLRDELETWAGEALKARIARFVKR
jgi:enoyl-CoA hydratase